jgi:hypothetical protein
MVIRVQYTKISEAVLRPKITLKAGYLRAGTADAWGDLCAAARRSLLNDRRVAIEFLL